MKNKQGKKVPDLRWALKEGCEQPDPVTGHWVLELLPRDKDNSKSDNSVDGFQLGEKVLVTKQPFKSMNGVRILGCKKEDR